MPRNAFGLAVAALLTPATALSIQGDEPYRYAPVGRTRDKLRRVTPSRARTPRLPNTLEASYAEAGLPALASPSPAERRAAANNRRTRTRLATRARRPAQG